jgi:hypothetical protein
MKNVLLVFYLAFLCSTVCSAQRKTYEYDQLNRVSKAHFWDGSVKKFTVTYGYDAVGNRLSKVITVICMTPTATLSGTQSINEGQSATLSVAFTGDTPYNFTANGQTYSNISSTPYNFSVSPTVTTNYTISQIANNCGIGTASGNAMVTVIPACQQPDLIISDIVVTKYTSDKVYYRVVVKNIGNQTVSLGSFSFSTYGSTNGSSKDVLKHVMFLGGGNLAQNQTINYDVSASMNYQSNQHYFVLMADHYGLITECNENNNEGSKVIKPCSNSGNATLTGNLPSGLLATNGKFDLVNFTPSPNTVITASSISGLPVNNINANNVTMQIGTCAQVASSAVSNQNTSTQTVSPKQNVEAIEIKDLNETKQLAYEVKQATTVSISIWDMEAKAKLKDISVGNNASTGLKTLDLSNEGLVAGKTYIIHFETAEGHWAKVVGL